MNLPILFEERMKRLLGDEYGEFLACYGKPYYGGLRVNILKLSPEEFERISPRSTERIPWIKNGYYYDTKEQPAKHPLYYGGAYYIQEPSAMTPASLLPIQKGDRVLDLCAAPGGKSTELGARLQGEGVLVSNDISNSRAKALLKNIELFGIRNALVLSEAPNKLTRYFPEYFDKILIDAPCSGEGMFRKSPAVMKNWEQYGVDYYNRLQKEIILQAAGMLKPGGYLLYSTCTFSPEENEGTIAYLLDKCPEFHVAGAIPEEGAQKEAGISYEGFSFGRPEWLTQLSSIPEEVQRTAEERQEELRNCIRLWPHKINGEGHFTALLYKEERAENRTDDQQTAVSSRQNTIQVNRYQNRVCYTDTDRNTVPKNGTNQHGKGKEAVPEEASEFIHTLGIPVKQEQLTVRENRVYLLPEGLPELGGLRILRQGLLLGEMKKQRFEPSQALACALKADQYGKRISLPLEDPRIIRYLKCETIELEGNYEDGWYLFCADDLTLGWIKAAKNSFKNKYLPGWRWV